MGSGAGKSTSGLRSDTRRCETARNSEPSLAMEKDCDRAASIVFELRSGQLHR